MKNECISRHEQDIIILQMKKKLLLKKLAELEREILITNQYNRELKGRKATDEYKDI